MYKNRFTSMLITFVTALVGGIVFNLIHSPLPWLLGSMLAVLIISKLTPLSFYWPSLLRNIGLVVIGYMIGRSFTKDTLTEMLTQLPSMLVMTVSIILASCMLAVIISKITGINLKTTITGSVPGGLSQMVTLGEEMKGVDLTVVTFIQVFRLMGVVFVVPFLASSSLFETKGPVEHSAANVESFTWSSSWLLVLLLLVAYGAGVMGKKLKFPTPYLLVPIILTAIIMLTGVHAPPPPNGLIEIAQIFMGAYLGLMLKPEQLDKKLTLTTSTIMTTLILIACSLGFGFALVHFHHVSFVTAFLSTSPGGMAEMAVVGRDVGASLSVLTGYQLFRILFILLIVPPTLKWLFKHPYFRDR